MIRFEVAEKIVLENVFELGVEYIALDKSLNRVLAEDAFSDINMPPFDKSAVDGYACRLQDINLGLEVIEIVQAGQTPSKIIGEAQCVKIMTGAPIPHGADKVIMVEHIVEEDNKIRATRNQQKSNICKVAEDVSVGQKVMEKCTLIKPKHIAVLASVGYFKVPVFKKPVVAVISTGDELVEPNTKPSKSQIRNSNGPQLLAQVRDMGIEAVYFGIAKDTRDDTLVKLKSALSKADVVLLSGGVSMGEYDFVPEILEQVGIKLLFSQIAIKPGKPTVFGTIDNKFIFGLPGNPVSSFVLFELLVKQLLYRMMGYTPNNFEIILPMGEDLKRSRTGRLSYIPVNIFEGKVFPVDYHGSGHIHSLIYADALIAMPIGKEIICKGELVHVRPI